MRRILGIAAVLLLFVSLAAGCGGKKEAGAVVKDLDGLVSKMESYSTTGTMVLNTGLQPQEYKVEVWYKKPSYYRIALTNDKKDVSQIVLRNDDGVFVLTPHLNKSFRFQSDWPKNQGQIYLFESLVESITMDQDRSFTTDKDSYVFDVAANYHNASLVRQKIWLNQKTYAPQHVEVSDANNNVLVSMSFNDFKFGAKFDKDSFDMQRNMTGERMTLPTMSENGGTGTTDEGNTSSDETGASQAANGTAAAGDTAKKQELMVIEPGYTPDGVEKTQIAQTQVEDNQKILIKYTGSYNYTLLESQPNDQPVFLNEGAPVDLGFSYGVLYGDEVKTLVWIYDNTEFRLTSSDLPEEEMIQVAASVQDQSAK